MGEQSVKNIARLVDVFAMNPAAIASLPAVPALPEATSERSGASTKTLLIAACLIAAVGIVAASAWRQWPFQTSPTATVQAPAVTPSSSAATGIASAAAPRLSIVVLPFTNLSNDPDQEYFVDGITDDLTTDLSQISDSFVIARNTAFTYKGRRLTRSRSPTN